MANSPSNTGAKIQNIITTWDNFGDDSALYEAMGFVRKSECRSGLTRKATAPPANKPSA